jgi:hypothetical protein
MLTQLPSEVIIELYSYLNFRDICNLRCVNNALYNKIGGIQEQILSKEMKRMDYIGSKANVYNMVLLHMVKSFMDLRKHLDTIWPDREYLMRHITRIEICNNTLVNNMFKRLFWHYLKQGSLSTYSNRFEMYTFYIFYITYIEPTTFNVNSNVTFLTNFANNSKEIKQIAVSYASFIIQKNLQPSIEPKFDTLSKMSQHVCTVPILKKLFGCRELNLASSQLFQCCSRCSEEHLVDVVNFKYSRPNDQFLSLNYMHIKDFLQKADKVLLAYMQRLELQIVNESISFRHPDTNRRIRLGSVRAKTLLFSLQYETPCQSNKLARLQRYIQKRQRELLQQYFK